jgi:PCI domain
MEAGKRILQLYHQLSHSGPSHRHDGRCVQEMGTGEFDNPRQSESIQNIAICKKWLISIQTSQLPKPTHPIAARSYHALSKEYDDFSAAFSDGSIAQLRAEYISNQETWSSDNNYGLVLLALDSFRSHGIRKLEKTYSSLSVSRIATRDFNFESTLGGGAMTPAGEAQTEQYLLAMIERGELKGKLSHAAPINTNPSSGSPKSSTPAGATLSFEPPPSSSSAADSAKSEAAVLANLEAQISRTVAMTEQIKLFDKKIGLSKEYLIWQSKNIGQSNGGDEGFGGLGGATIPGLSGLGTNSGGPGGRGFWNDNGDEDMMDDVGSETPFSEPTAYP